MRSGLGGLGGGGRRAGWRAAQLGVVAVVAMWCSGCGGDDPADGPADALTDAPVSDVVATDSAAHDSGPADVFTRAPCETSDDCQDPGSPCQYASCVAGVGCVTFALPDGAVCKHGDAACFVAGTCSGAVCEGAKPKDCDDGEVCTVDTCAKGVCAHDATDPAKTVPCDDGDVCTKTDLCAEGKCKPGASACQCAGDSDCADIGKDNKCAGTYYCDLEAGGTCKQNPATVVLCASTKDTDCIKNQCDPKTGACKMSPVNDGSGCDDGEKCTIGDTCQFGICKAGPGVCCTSDVDCDALSEGLCKGSWFCNKAVGQCFLNPATVVLCGSTEDTACAVNVCDDKSGKCTMKPTKDAIPCDDGNPCTPSDACDKGTCKSAKNLCPCQVDADCAGKDNGNLCDGGLFCEKNTGTCVPDPTSVKTCPNVDDTHCLKNQCNAKTGQCEKKPVPNLTQCYDDNPCTTGDVCENGSCKPGKDACKCSSDADCGAWEDGDLCNGTLFCDKSSNTCKVDPKSVVGCPSAENTECKQSLCQPKTGVCTVTFVNQGLSCDDGVPCTVGDVCDAGSCKAGTDVCLCKTDAECASQDDGDLCNGLPFCDKGKVPWLCKTNPATVIQCKSVDDTYCEKNLCQPQTGKCVKTSLNVGLPCDDGNPCTLGTECKTGVCVNPNLDPKNPCDDNNPCTNDNCDPKAGCLFTANTSVCDDGDKCTEGDQCAAKACKPGKAAKCGDDNPCTTEICNAKVGCIQFENASVCNDGDKCTPLDVCKAGVCVPGPSKTCFDGKPCTLDSCDPKTGSCVFNSNLAGSVICDDGVSCTTDSCDASTGCKHVPTSSACNDGLTCTKDVCTVGVGCTYVPVASACDDKNTCTVDTCVPGKGCLHAAPKDGTTCNDGKPCTIGDSCKAGKCVSGPVAQGCLVDPKQCQGKTDGSACNDGDACTKGETCLSGACRAAPVSVVVTNVVGNGSKYHVSEEGYRTQARLYDALAVAVAPDGTLVFAQRTHDQIRGVDLSGNTFPIAGSGHEAEGYRDGPASVARFRNPGGLAVAQDGTIYVADTDNHRLRVISTDGQVTTLAGSGAPKFADGKGSAASFNRPYGIAFGPQGALFVTDFNNNRVRRVLADGTVTTLAGQNYGFKNGVGTAAGFNHPLGIAWSPRGFFVVADYDGNAVRTVKLDGTVNTLARHAKGYGGLVDGKGGNVRLNHPFGVVVDTGGVAWITDTGNHAIRSIQPDGTVKTHAGGTGAGYANGVGKAAKLNSPRGVALHPSGALYVAEYLRMRRVVLRRHGCSDGSLCTDDTCDPVSGKCSAGPNPCEDGAPACLLPTCDAKTGACTVKAASDGAPCDDNDACTTAHTCYAGHCTAPSKVSMLAGKPGGSVKYDYGKSDGAPATARFNRPAHAARAPGGGIYVTDSGNNLIRHVADDGWVTTVAGQPNVSGSKDGPATSASFNNPMGIAVDDQGWAWIADHYNHRIRRMSPSHEVSTLAGSVSGAALGTGSAAKFNRPLGLDLDAAGAAIVADHLNHRLRRVTSDGKVSHVVGQASAGHVDGPVATARLHYPYGVHVAASGDIYFTETGSHSVRRVAVGGWVETVVGRKLGFRDALHGRAAWLHSPSHVITDSSGVLYIADRYNHRVRARFPDGRVTTLAGHGKGVADGVGKGANFGEPFGLLLRGSKLLVLDHGAHELRTLDLAQKGCDDKNACTVDRCAPLSGCVSTPMVDGSACDDGAPCTLADTCAKGVCKAGKAAPKCACTQAGACDDKSPCTADTCDPATGCVNTPILEGRPCDDGSLCTTGEVCTDGKCATHTANWSTWGWAGGNNGTQGDGWRRATAGSQATAGIGYVCGTDVDAAGTLWIADCSRHSVRTMSASGDITTVAGPNVANYSGYVDGHPDVARFNSPQDVAIGIDGVARVADYNNHRVRAVAADGTVSTLAGQGGAGFADGKGAAAKFYNPSGVAVDPVGNVYVADRSNRRIRRIAPDGQVSTLAGDGKNGDLDGVGASARFSDPFDVELGPKGQLYVADTKGAVRRVSPGGLVLTLHRQPLSGTAQGLGLFGGVFGHPSRLTVAPDGTIYVADESRRRVVRLSKGGLFTILAGNGQNIHSNGIGAKASIYAPRSVSVMPGGHLFVGSLAGGEVTRVEHAPCDDHNRCTVDSCDPKKGCVHKPAVASAVCDDRGPCVTPTCDPKVGRCTWATKPNGSLCGSTCADLCTEGVCERAGLSSTWLGTGASGLTTGPRATAKVTNPYGMTHDGKGTVYVTDAAKHALVKIDPNDTVSVLAGAPGKAGYQEGKAGSARFSEPRGVAVTPAGGILVADYNNHRVRTVSLDGTVGTLAGSAKGYKDSSATLARFNGPTALSVRADGFVAVADLSNHRIRGVDTKGNVTTLAGSSYGFIDSVGAKAQFRYPNGVAWGKKGQLYILDSGNYRVRVLQNGVVTSVAGWSAASRLGKGAQVAGLTGATSLALLKSGDLLVTSNKTSRVRRVQTNGTVRSFVGSSHGAVEGLGPAAQLNQPISLLELPNGDVLVGQLYYRISRVRSDVTSCTALRGVSKFQPASSCQEIQKTKGFDDIETVWIDVDGSGPLPPMATRCDLSQAGGGWTKVTEETPDAVVNALLGGKGQVMYKCSDTSTSYVVSPVTTSAWKWSAKAVAPGDWQVSNGSGPAKKLACGAHKSFTQLTCGFGFGCAAGGAVTDAYVIPGTAGTAKCADTKTAFTGGPMTVCTKPASGGPQPNPQYGAWSVFVRKAP